MDIQNRRRFLATLSSAAAVALVDAQDSFSQEAPPETTTVRLGKIYGICIAPQYVAEDLLRAEGFTDIRYVAANPGIATALALARGEIDFTTNYAPPMAISIDSGEPITIIGGEHVGCFEVFAKEGIRSVADLKGKNVGVQSIGSSQHVFLSVIAAHVGLDPAKEIHWVTSTSPKPMDLFADGKIDAFLGLPPEPQELRARKNRPRDRQQRPRSSVVPIFLLRACRESRVHSKKSDRDQARTARHRESRRSLRHRADAGGATDRRCRVRAQL